MDVFTFFIKKRDIFVLFSAAEAVIGADKVPGAPGRREKLSLTSSSLSFRTKVLGLLAFFLENLFFLGVNNFVSLP